MAATPSSGSITSPVPDIINVCSRSATIKRASSLLKILSVRQSFASSTAALVIFPLYDSSLPSNFSNNVSASAVAPENPVRTFSPYILLIFLALCFNTVLPIVICPSPPIATFPSRLIHSIVVPLNISCSFTLNFPFQGFHFYPPPPLEGGGGGRDNFHSYLCRLTGIFFSPSLAKGCALSYISIRCVISRWVYFCVVESDECPRSSCITLRSAPP